jgi:hypothetical protein
MNVWTRQCEANFLAEKARRDEAVTAAEALRGPLSAALSAEIPQPVMEGWAAWPGTNVLAERIIARLQGRTEPEAPAEEPIGPSAPAAPETDPAGLPLLAPD